MIQIATFDDKQYKICNGTYYNINTDDKVIEKLEEARRFHIRVRLHYGTPDTNGELIPIDVLDEWNSTGYIGRSMGPCKIPLLIKNNRSMGGGGILTDWIIKITRSSGKKDVLYKHPRYQLPCMEFKVEQENQYPYVIYVGGKEHARFKTLEAAKRYVNLFTSKGPHELTATKT